MNELATYSSENVRSQNSMEAYSILSFPLGSIEAGADNLWWGPGQHGALLLSDNSTNKDLIKLSGSYNILKFTYVTADLSEEHQRKYFSGHRLEVRPFRGVCLGITETVIYGPRLEPRLVNPFTFYYLSGPAVKNGGDNKALGIDFDLARIQNMEIYGEFLVDDFQIDKGLNSLRAWNSKLGILLGGYWIDPFRFKDTELRMEYAFINQYAYTHRNQKYTYR